MGDNVSDLSISCCVKVTLSHSYKFSFFVHSYFWSKSDFAFFVQVHVDGENTENQADAAGLSFLKRMKNFLSKHWMNFRAQGSAKQVDLVARCLFPCSFIFFAVVYWIYCIHKSGYNELQELRPVDVGDSS